VAAITDVLGIWKLAATLMGENALTKVLSTSSITLPLERTFDQLYDTVREIALKSGDWDFAKRTRALRLAPTIDFRGIKHDWAPDWRYVYAPPLDMIKFLHFDQDIPEAGLSNSYVRLALPIRYGSESDLPTLLVYQYTTLPDNLYQEWMRGSFFDSGYDTEFVVVDKEHPTTTGRIELFLESDMAVEVTTSAVKYDDPSDGSGLVFNLQTAETAGLVNLPATGPLVTLYFAYGDPRADETTDASITQRTNHIVTNLRDARAAYIADIIDPTLWPVEFQRMVAAQLALDAAGVHAKSTKLIQRLEQTVDRTAAVAGANLTADDGFFEGGQVSSAELARL